ncbi:MAG: GumC family protein [Pyrinomonadaceae bacterium]
MKKNSLATTDRSAGQVPQYIPDPDSGYGYEYYGAGNSESQKHQIRKVLSILRRYWLLIVGTTAVVTALVIFYEAQKPDFYVANAKVQVNNETNPAMGGAGGGSIVLSQGADPAYFATQLRVLEGSGLLRRVVRAVDLEHNDAFRRSSSGDLSAWQKVLRMFGLFGKPPKASDEVIAQNLTVLEIPHESEADLDRDAEKLAPYVDAIQNGLSISPVRDSRTATKETRMIDIVYRHTDPIIATKVANAIADIYVLQNLEQKVASNATASEFLEKRVAELQNQIRTSEERLMNYSRENQIISLDPGQNTVVQRLADLNTKLGLAESERISAEAAYLAAKQNPMSGAVAESSDPRTAGLETQLTSLRQQLAQLKTEFTDEWPEVKRVKQQISQIEGELQTNRKRAKDTQASLLEQKYREALAKERELRGNLSTQRTAVLAQNEAAVNYRIIQQEIDSNRILLASLLAKSRETDVVLNGTPNNVLVADRALVPQSPAGPERAKNILVALFASLFAGIGFAVVANWLNDKIQISDDIEEQVGLPVLGRIPGIHQRTLMDRLPFTRRLASKSEAPANFERPIVVEAFNEVRASLLLSAGNGSPRTVLITSGEASEGKTLTSFNLAKCLAQLGGRVLLIDADLRCPQMHHINGTGNESGLSSLLTTNVISQESIDVAITENIRANLDLMTAGPAVADPATLLSRGKFRELLEKLEIEYQYIVIDSPPVLYFADSVLLATVVDSVLVVGRMNFSSSEILGLSAKKLQSVNANVVGIVLNDIPLKDLGYGRNGYYLNDVEYIDANGDGSNGKMLGLG